MFEKEIEKAYLNGNRFIDDCRAMHPVITGVVTLALVGIIFGIMVMVYAAIEPSIKGTSAASNTSITAINTNVYSGFNLGAITPIVLAASLIITVVLGFAYGMGGNQQ